MNLSGTPLPLTERLPETLQGFLARERPRFPYCLTVEVKQFFYFGIWTGRQCAKYLVVTIGSKLL
jgi:hypothetical protein